MDDAYVGCVLQAGVGMAAGELPGLVAVPLALGAGTIAYRRHVAGVLTRRAALIAAERATNKGGSR